MKKVLAFLGAAIYGLLISYLFWFGFLKLDDWTMTFEWKGVIISLFVISPLAIAFASFVEVLICVPIALMVKVWKHAKWLPTLFAIFYGISSLRLPWLYYEHYSAQHIVMAILMDIVTLIIFVQMLGVIWKKNNA